MAQDSHPSRGSYTFSIGSPGPPPPGDPVPHDVGSVSPPGLLLQALARWLHFIGLALTFGVLAFQFLVLREPVPASRLRPLVLAGLLLLILSEPLALVGQAVSLGGPDSPSLASLLGSSFGRLLALRLGTALALWGLLGALEEGRWRAVALVAALGGGLAVVDGLGGHSIGSGPAVPLAYLLTAAHVAAMAVWVGGIASLVAMGEGDGRASWLRRFAPLAALATGILILTGGLLAFAHLERLSDLAYSAYGLTLSAKVIAVGAALLAAGLGLRGPRSTRPELVTVLGVLALAGLLASLPPIR